MCGPAEDPSPGVAVQKSDEQLSEAVQAVCQEPQTRRQTRKPGLTPSTRSDSRDRAASNTESYNMKQPTGLSQPIRRLGAIILDIKLELLSSQTQSSGLTL